MTEFSPQAEPRTGSPSIHWLVATALALLALAGGVLLGRTAFVEQKVVTVPSIDPALVETGFTGTLRLEFRDDAGVLVLHLTDMPTLGDDEVYQVWLLHGANPVSVGVLPSWKTQWAISGDPNTAQALFITREPSPLGSESPSEDPVVRFDLSEFWAED